MVPNSASSRSQAPKAPGTQAGMRPVPGTRPVDHQGLLALSAVEDDRDLPAEPVEVRLDHLQDEPGGDCRVEGVAAALQHGHAAGGGEPVGGGHHPVGAAQLRPGDDHDHDAPFGSARGIVMVMANEPDNNPWPSLDGATPRYRRG